MKARFIILTLWLLPAIPGWLGAQSIKKTGSVKLSYQAVQASIDRQGNVYIASSNGDIDRYNSDGTLAYHFSPNVKGNVSLIESWQGLRAFVFYRDFQQYLFLDRFLNASEPYYFRKNTAEYYELATLAGDNNLWLLDQQQLSLKKLDIELNEFLSETPLNLTLDPKNFELTHIREYQNLLFISDKNSGVLVFDNLGNYLETLPFKNLDYFSFTDDELVGITHESKVRWINLYTKKEREISLPDPSYEFILMENRRLYCIGQRRMDIFELQ